MAFVLRNSSAEKMLAIFIINAVKRHTVDNINNSKDSSPRSDGDWMTGAGIAGDYMTGPVLDPDPD